MVDYHRVLTRTEGGEFVAQVFEIPWCVATGVTPTEALHNLDEALVWALKNSQRVKGCTPPPFSESEWGDIVGKRLEDLCQSGGTGRRTGLKIL